MEKLGLIDNRILELLECGENFINQRDLEIRIPCSSGALRNHLKKLQEMGMITIEFRKVIGATKYQSRRKTVIVKHEK